MTAFMQRPGLTGYFEPIVPPALFYAVQKQLQRNKGKGGRKQNWGNG
jgi:hypothetical protein